MTDIGAPEWKFKVHSHDGVVQVCPKCMHAVCYSMYFVKAAAVCTTGKKQDYAIQDTPLVQWFTSMHYTAASLDVFTLSIIFY